MDPEATDTNWKARAGAALAWAEAHPGVTIPLICFMAGVVLGGLLF